MSTPDTTRFFYSAYAIIFVTLTFYVISLIVRWNNLRGDLEVLEDLEKETK
jgi:CcmD family protein